MIVPSDNHLFFLNNICSFLRSVGLCVVLTGDWSFEKVKYNVIKCSRLKCFITGMIRYLQASYSKIF